ncbi:MAG: GTP-binding protein [Candidatus Heimdallarchaeota archaeon]|nr:GTP-binding protein [Candidatus Heimdallarchaeota archaeon]
MSFLINLFKSRTKRVNLSICGLDNAGKTAITNYLIHGEFRQTIPTMGVNREVIDFPKLKLDIFDLGGQIDLRSMWESINERSDALIFIVDSTDHMRMEEAKEVFYNILETQVSENIPVMLLLNKVDLENRITREEFISLFDLADLQFASTWACFETSAKTGIGIFDAFQWFVNVLREV